MIPENLKKVFIPLINPNDDEYIIIWEVNSGEKVNKNQIIANLESSKAIFELTAELSGYLYILDKSENVRPNKLIALISESEISDLKKLSKHIIEQTETKEIIEIRRFTKKAEILAKENKINIDDIKTENSLVKEQDVENYLKRINKTKTNENEIEWTFISYNQSKRLLLIGGGMNAVQCLDVLRRSQVYYPVGILDDSAEKQNTKIKGVPVLGKISEFEKFWQNKEFDEAVILMPNHRKLRIKLFERLKQLSVPLANIIDSSVIISSEVSFGEGNLILSGVRFGTCSEIGNNNFFSSAVNIAHHNNIGDHNTFGPNVTTSGNVTICNDVTFGTGICTEPNIIIEDGAVIGSGAVIIRSVSAKNILKTKIIQ